MAGITFMTTADEGTTARWTTATASISNTYARTGTYSFKMEGGNHMSKSVASSATCPYARVCFYASAAGIVKVIFRESTNEHLYVSLNFTAGTVIVGRQTTPLATYSAGLQTSTWYCLECTGVLSTTVGTSTVKLNRDIIAELTLTGLNNAQWGGAVCDNIDIYNADI